MTGADPLLCSLVIPTRNAGPLFAELLAALQRQTLWPRTEFIVVDSGSDDGTPARAQAAGARVIAIDPATFDHGLTRDLAIAAAGCEAVVLMVQDAVPADDFLLERLTAALGENGVAGAYARQIPRPEADLITKRNLAAWPTGRTVRDVRRLTDPAAYAALSPRQKYMFCTFDNVCSAVRKSVWRDEPFGPSRFGEDIAWAERVLLRGYAIVYEPAAAVIHSHDRPLAYEYARTYVCHRQLYRQFGLADTPTLPRALWAWVRATGADMLYIMRAAAPPTEKLAMLASAPVANAARILGQYRAVRDARAGRPARVGGV